MTQILKKCYLGSSFLLFVALNVFAETPADATLLEEVQPPPKVIEGQPMDLPDDATDDAPDITIRKKDGKTIQEYRVNGELYMIKVTNKNGKSYYLHKRDKDGVWENIGPNPPTAVPQWVLFRF